MKVPEKPTKTLAQVRAELRRDRDLKVRVDERITANLKLAVELGGSAPDLAADAGVTVGRVSQAVGGVRKVREAAGVEAPKSKRPAKPKGEAPADRDPESAPAEAESDARPELPERYRPGATARVRQLGDAAGLVSDRWDKPRTERPTLFVDVDSGDWWDSEANCGRMAWRAGSPAELLAGLPQGIVRVYFAGPRRPGVTPDAVRRHGSEAAAARAWFLGAVPEGWVSGGHFLADDAKLVGRWLHVESGREVEVQHAATWFGHGDYDSRTAAQAWYVLRQEVAKRFPGGVLMSTPATTGRDLWRRIIPKGREFPVLSRELRELIQSTSGQGRRELVAHEPVTLPLVSQYDMRLAYAALAWGMPVGLPTMMTGREWAALDDEEQHRTLRRRGRWLVRATVPSNWEHVGILPTPRPDGTWEWPSRPGSSFTSWCSGSEVALAREHGWRVDIQEGFHFAEGKPLNTWRDGIVGIYEAERPGVPPYVNRLVRQAARLMVLATIGSFASRSRVVTHTTADADRLPADAQVREVAGAFVWETAEDRSEWTERTAHPEWAAEIWARCRTRLLEAPAIGGVRIGALHVPPGSVIGMRTDGLTLAGDPGWPDEGKPGQFRLTGRMRGTFEWPQTDAALSALKRFAEGALETGEMQ